MDQILGPQKLVELSHTVANCHGIFLVAAEEVAHFLGYGYGVFATYLDASVYIDMQCNADVFSLVS